MLTFNTLTTVCKHAFSWLVLA